uniref:AMP-dependent synthetase/ligase domain-containing protein n=1 Tax=Anopheles atroparvus TaxID=41427 RepID=A0A182IV29_ANOAO
MTNFQPTYDAESRTWHGPTVKGVFNPEASIGQVVFEVLSRSPERVMQIDMDTGRSMTYAEFMTRMIRFAQNLATIGIRKGDVVALANANSENLAPLVCALLSIGAPLSPLAPGFNQDDMANMLGVTQPKLVFCDANNYETVRAAVIRVIGKKTPPIYVFEDTRDDVRHAEELMKETGQEDKFIPIYLGDTSQTLAAIVCSSGTTGAHKGVSQSHANLMQFSAIQPFHPKPIVFFNFSAIYWVSGLSSLLYAFTTGGIRLFTRNGFNEEQFFEAIEKYNVNNIFTPPAYANAVLCDPRLQKIDFSSINLWILGGSFVPEDLRDKIDALLPNGRSVNAFGSSEGGGLAMDFLMRTRNAIGPVMPGACVRVVDENGNILGVGERGEFLVKTGIPFLGYYNNPEATMNAVDEEGYYRSGDIGYIDEKGVVYLVDRKKDIFKYKNFHVTPSELEALIRKIDGVQDVSVVGIPDEAQVTDLPAALIVRKPNSVLDAQTVQSIIDNQVTDFKRLRGGVHFVSELPKTEGGKVMRRKVAEIVQRMNAAAIV